MFLKSNKPAAKIETIVGPGTEMEGNIQSSESIRIDGKIKGGVQAQSVVVGEYGVVLGDITARNVTIAGKVKGNISANESLELLPKGQIIGDLRTTKLVISDGANFEGNCQMLKSNGQVIEVNPQSLPAELENGHNRNLKVANSNKH
jgi:cytoskeletal protein CcmA (bactofilin family)